MQLRQPAGPARSRYGSAGRLDTWWWRRRRRRPNSRRRGYLTPRAAGLSASPIIGSISSLLSVFGEFECGICSTHLQTKIFTAKCRAAKSCIHFLVGRAGLYCTKLTCSRVKNAETVIDKRPNDRVDRTRGLRDGRQRSASRVHPAVIE